MILIIFCRRPGSARRPSRSRRPAGSAQSRTAWKRTAPGKAQRAGVKQINRSLVDMANSFGAKPIDAFVKIYFWAALPEIIGGIRIGFIRAVKGVIIGQLLISIVRFGSLFELYSSRFLMSHFWAIILVLFALAFTISELLAMLAKRFDYYASKRG